MAKRGDNIHKRKDGRWEGRYKKGRYPDGSIQYGSVYGKSYAEAKKKLENILADNTITSIHKFSKKTFGEILNMWMDNNRLKLKGATINKYQSLIDTHILPTLGHIKITDLTATIINAFLSEKLKCGRLDNKGGLSPTYVKSIMLVINAAMQYAVQEKFCSPLKTPICKPVVNKTEIQVLSIDEQRKLETHLRPKEKPTNLGILLSLHMGLRIGEICALSWEDVDFTNRIIKVRHTVARVRDESLKTDRKTCLIIDSPKTKASVRDIPIPSALLPDLYSWKRASSSKYVVSEKDTFVSPRTFEYRYHCILTESGVKSINYHALRHTFATRCIEAGVDVKSLSEILGHANVGVTLNTYVHSSIEMKRTQLEKLISTSD